MFSNFTEELLLFDLNKLGNAKKELRSPLP
jgi:hypothetical protein